VEVPASALLRSATDRLLAVPPPVAIFFWSRLLIWLTALYAWIWFQPRVTNPQRDLGYVTEIWARADASWFVGIAQYDYQRNDSAVFYPSAPVDAALLPPALPCLSRSGCDRDDPLRDRIVLVVSSFLLAIAIVEWSAGQWVS
jgi:hypothetical protein